MMNDVPTLLDRHIIVGGHRIAAGMHGAGDPPCGAFCHGRCAGDGGATVGGIYTFTLNGQYAQEKT